MAQGASDLVKDNSTPFGAFAGVGVWRRTIGKSHHHLELHPVGENVHRILICLISCVVGIGAGYIVGRRFFRALASGILFCGGGENLVGDSHFDVVGFAREDCDGLVLRLPSETSYGAVVAAAIGMAFDAKRSARGS